MKRIATQWEDAATKARRALVLKNMCDLMKSMGQDDKFDNPDAWMDSIVERPRQAVAGSPAAKCRVRGLRRPKAL